MESEQRPPKKGKKRITAKPAGNGQGDASPIKMIPVKDIRTHPLFESLLRIDEAEQERLRSKMAEEGFWESQVLVLGFWPGIDGGKPVVIDGHRRLRACRDNGIEVVPCSIKEFADLMAGLRRVIGLQVERRQNSDGAFYALTEQFDTLMERGRPRKGEEARKLVTGVTIFDDLSTSARRTAKIIGCNYRKIYKIRRIRKEGSAELQEAVRGDQISINKAHTMIREMQLGTDENKRNAAHTRLAKKLLTEENFEVLKALGGDIYEKINAAIEYYRSSLNDKDRGPDPEE
jgi:hypothetical protein